MVFIDMAAENCENLAREATKPVFARVTCSSDFSEVQHDWLALEADGVATPYQTFDWSRAWAETAGASSGVEPMLVTGHDHGGRVVAILPLGIRRNRGIAVASFLGDKHSNINLGLFDRHAMARLTRGDLEAMLRQAAGARGVDLYMLLSQPKAFAETANPMAMLPNNPCPSSSWSTPLQPDGEAMIRSLRSSESLRKLRAKARKLGEAGPLRFVQPDETGGIAATLEAFLAQKRGQFQKMGVSDPYRDCAVQQFLIKALQPRDGRKPPVSLWALMVGDKVAAVFGAATHAGRRTGMFMSYDLDPALARSSPGELLLQHVIRASCHEGLSVFDLGTGDGPYKKDYCPVQEALVDSVLPMTIRGRAAGLALHATLAAKSAAKRSALAQWSITRLRKAKAQLSGA